MFSVVIPAFNAQLFIARAIESVLAQDFSDFEIIVVDDGSTDDTARQVSKFSDPRIILIRQKNKGEGGARNTGIQHARRSWVALLDADDYWFSDHLGELARVIDAFPDVGMVATSFVAGEAWHASPPKRRSQVIERIDYFAAAAREIGVVWSSTAAIRREVAAETGSFGDFRRGADQEYWVRMALETPVARSRRVTAYYFRHAGGVMSTDHLRGETAPEKIENMWPSVAVIRSIENNPLFRDKKQSMIAYERHATFLSMTGYISRGEFDVSRRLARRLPGSRLDRAALIALILELPNTFICGLLHARAIIKWVRASFVSYRKHPPLTPSE